jgi:hypothetical protein
MRQQLEASQASIVDSYGSYHSLDATVEVRLSSRGGAMVLATGAVAG